MSDKNCSCSSETCGCCEGIQAVTPMATANRPGLNSLSYRIGSHSAFLETMKARLSTMDVTVNAGDGQTPYTVRPLQKLTTRDAGDPSIALLDGWATVADVLTFYQERIANEAYLRTATERRSVLELANLVGYQARPGVASTVYLAYTLDDNQKVPVEIPAGARAQSQPDPGELPQQFETSEKLLARTEWSNLQARVTQPQVINLTGKDRAIDADTLYFQGVGTGLKPNDPLLLDFGSTKQVLLHVKSVEADFAHNRTKVVLHTPPAALVAAGLGANNPDPFDTLVEPLSRPPTPQVASSAFLKRKLDTSFEKTSDSLPQLASLFSPSIADTIYAAWSNATVSPLEQPKIYALRVKVAPFGSTAPRRPITDERGKVIDSEEWPLAGAVKIGIQAELNNRFDGGLVEFSVADDGNAASVSTEFSPGDHEVLLDLGTSGKWKVGVSPGINFCGFEFSSNDPQDIVVLTVNIDDTSDEITITNKQEDRSDKLLPGKSVRYSGNSNTVSIEYTKDLLLIYSQLIAFPSDPKNILYLDAQYDSVSPNTWVAIVRTNPDGIDNPLFSLIDDTQIISKTAYNISGKSTQLTLDKAWLGKSDLHLSDIRKTTVYAQSEELQLSERPVSPDNTGKPVYVKENVIALQRLYDGLQSGRWIIVSGERTDVIVNNSPVEGIKASELAMISAVSQAPSQLAGDKVHTTLTLAKELKYSYKLETVSIFANVVKATHGSTTAPPETLGAGDSSKALQTFTLKQPPITFVPASNPTGVDSTLKVYVNDVEWKQTDSLAGLGARDRNFVTQTDDDGNPSVIFGNGRQGARLPTGLENVKAIYRSGIGKPGNVKAEQIRLLQTRPLGVKEVINPRAASGGADKESRDQIRDNAPLAVMALDRLVSVQDYADFTRTFAGIGKATARKLSDGRRQLVHITIAGADDIPIDDSSDLYRNLLSALRQLGDPDLALKVEVRELLVLTLSANIRLVPGYLWEPVKTAVTAAILDAYGFQKRALGQAALLCELIALIQAVPGVDYVDVDSFNGIPEKVNEGGARRPLYLDELSKAAMGKSETLNQPNPYYIPVNLAGFEKDGSIRPAQLSMFTLSVPDTLVLNQIY